MPFPSVALLDNFTRANEGPPPSASWVTSDVAGLKVASNLCVSANLGSWAASAWNTQFTADQEVAITIGYFSGGPYSSVSVRQQVNNNYESDHYEFGFFFTGIQVYKEVGGVFTQLGADINHGSAWTIGDVFGGRITGSTLEVFRNGVSLATRSDSSITGAGYTGAGLGSAAAGSDTRYSAFYGGSYSSGVTPTSHHLLLLGVGQ
jgi:hypothetical protein